MADICENCGAELKEGAQFCQECGDKIEKEKTRIYCTKCGADITDSDTFCENCGTNINDKAKENPIKKYKIPILIIIAVVALIIVGSLIYSSMNSPSDYTLPPQRVTVGGEYFEIPGKFIVDPSSIDVTTESGVVSFSQGWESGAEHIYIGIISSGYTPNGVDLDSVAALNGGVKKTMMGYEGYYIEEMNDYTFSFVLGDKICIINTSSPYLFDEIEVL